MFAVTPNFLWKDKKSTMCVIPRPSSSMLKDGLYKTSVGVGRNISAYTATCPTSFDTSGYRSPGPLLWYFCPPC